MSAVINFWSKLLNKVEPGITLELDEIVYSKKHGHDICVMHLVGKNIFPKMTAEEILSNKQAMAGLSNEDLIKITRLDMEIKYKRNNFRVVEIDRNGMVLVENQFKERIRYSEKLIVSDPKLQDQLNGRDGVGIGYRVGLKEGAKTTKYKQDFLKRFLSLFKNSKA